MLAVALIAAAGYWIYHLVQPRLQQRQAIRYIGESQLLLDRVGREEELGTYVSDYDEAREDLREARARVAEGDFGVALEHAKASRRRLTGILNGMLYRRPLGEGQFIAVDGEVEYRHGSGGEWQQATGRVVLASGDFVRTGGGGQAEIMFADGTLYTVRPNTLFVVRSDRSDDGSKKQAIAMEYGWVNLSTAEGGSRVSLPGAEATVAGLSEGQVTYDEEAQKGRFAAFSGAMKITSDTGASRDVGPLQEVLTAGVDLTATRDIPGRPALLAPRDNHEVVLDEDDRLVLRWEPVPSATSYALQVSRHRSFLDNVIDVESRTRPEATLGIRGAGTFVWQVKAIGANGTAGPWSELQRFRVRERATNGAAPASPPVENPSP